MLQLLESIKQRQQELLSICLLDVTNILKDEKERIKIENQQLDLLYRFQKVSQDEKTNFYYQSLRLMNKSHQQLLTTNSVYDAVAKLYTQFYQENQQEEKATKINLIVENDMHKNQSFLILMIKWLLEWFRAKLKSKLSDYSRPTSRFKRNAQTIEPIKFPKKLDSNIPTTYTKRIRILSLTKTPDPEISTSLNTRKNYSLHRQHKLYNAIPDLDWESIKENTFKQLLNRNMKIQKSILKNL